MEKLANAAQLRIRPPEEMIQMIRFDDDPVPIDESDGILAKLLSDARRDRLRDAIIKASDASDLPWGGISKAGNDVTPARSSAS
jgi:hypothetical protein